MHWIRGLNLKRTSSPRRFRQKQCGGDYPSPTGFSGQPLSARTLDFLAADEILSNFERRNQEQRIGFPLEPHSLQATDRANYILRCSFAPQSLIAGPGGLYVALQSLAQLFPPVKQSAFHRFDRETHESSDLSRG